MEENMVAQEIVNQVAENTAETAVTAITEAATEIKPVAPTKSNNLWKNLAIGAGGMAVGAGLEYVAHRWIIPKVSNMLEKHKIKKAERKAKKEAKKAEKQQKQQPAPVQPEQPTQPVTTEGKVE